jgi:hypothetical protein
VIEDSPLRVRAIARTRLPHYVVEAKTRVLSSEALA